MIRWFLLLLLVAAAPTDQFVSRSPNSVRDNPQLFRTICLSKGFCSPIMDGVIGETGVTTPYICTKVSPTTGAIMQHIDTSKKGEPLCH